MNLTPRMKAAALLVILASLGAGYFAGSREAGPVQALLQQQEAQTADLKAELQQSRQETEALVERLTALEEQAQAFPPPDPHLADLLKSRGISSPEMLLEDLRSHPEVIPLEAVLGGTMYFTRTAILDERWVYGAYEDGHVAGAALFQWSLREGRPVWAVVYHREE